MIDGGSGGAAGAAAFPDPPKGEPGAIAAIARRMHDAASDLETAQGALRQASTSLEVDWRGYAANAYHGCVAGLSGVTSGAVDSFRDCAQAVSGYGTALDDVQQRVKSLKRQYDDAVRRQAAAQAHAQQLGGQITAHTKPADATRISHQASKASTQAGDALHDADHFAQLAQQAITEFKGKARGYASTLENGGGGQTAGGTLGSPFVAGGVAGPAFGLPANRFTLDGPPIASPIDQYDGTIHVGDPWHSDIPGYGVYMDATHGNLQPVGDLTDAVMFVAAPVAGKILTEGGAEVADWIEIEGRDKVASAGRTVAGRTAAGLSRVAEPLTDPDVFLVRVELAIRRHPGILKDVARNAVKLALRKGHVPDWADNDLVDHIIDHGDDDLRAARDWARARRARRVKAGR